MGSSRSADNASRCFSEAAPEILGELQRRCIELLEALPRPIDRAVDLQRALELDKKLAWQVFKIARAAQPLAEGLNVPAKSAVRRLLASARSHGVDELIITGLGEAFDAFESLVNDHAGDRDTFGSMMSAMVHDVGEEVTERQRIAMYRANSYLWGLRADAVARTVILHPSAEAPDRLDVATIYGFINLHRLRHAAPLQVTVGAGERGEADRPASDDDRNRSPEELPMLLEEFSTGAMGPVTFTPHPHLAGRAQLDLPGLGRGASVSFYTLQLRCATVDSPPPELDNSAGIATPMAMLQCDLLVPERWSNPATVAVTSYGSRTEFPPPLWEVTPASVLPYRIHASTFHRATSVPDAPDMPHYRNAMSHVLHELGWETTRFDIYRCRVPYPFFHTIIRLHVDPT